MNQLHQAQWHDVVPKRTIEWEDGPEGGAVLLVPRFRKGPLAKWLLPRLKQPHMRVKLDKIGSFVWSRLDGRANFNAIADAMRNEFGEAAEPTEERLTKFLTILYRDKFVSLHTPSSSAVELDAQAKL